MSNRQERNVQRKGEALLLKRYNTDSGWKQWRNIKKRKLSITNKKSQLAGRTWKKNF